MEEKEKEKYFIVAEAIETAKGCFLDETGWPVRDFDKAIKFETTKECKDWLSTKKGGYVFTPVKYTKEYIDKINNRIWMAWRKSKI